MKKIRFGLLGLGWFGAVCPALALNAIHESTYSAFPYGLTREWGALHTALIVPKGADGFAIPVALAMALGPKAELGAGFKTWLGDEPDIPQMTLGAQFAVDAGKTLGLHFLYDLNGGDRHGLTATYLGLGGLGKKLASETTFRLGFMDALVEDKALMALEGGYALRLRLASSVSLQAGLLASSQTKAFNDHFALDFEPQVRVGTSGRGAVATVVTLGLAGERRETLRIKVGWIHGF